MLADLAARKLRFGINREASGTLRATQSLRANSHDFGAQRRAPTGKAAICIGGSTDPTTAMAAFLLGVEGVLVTGVDGASGAIDEKNHRPNSVPT